MASLCHPWFTTTNLSYRFPIFETSATALCGTTGMTIISYWIFVMVPNDVRVVCCGFLAMIQRCKGRTRSDKLSCRLQLASFVLELAVNSHSSISVQHCGQRFPRGHKFLPKISFGAKRTQPSCLGGEAFGIGNRSAAFHGAVLHIHHPIVAAQD